MISYPFKRAVDLSDNELAAIVAKANLTVQSAVHAPSDDQARFICARKSRHVDHRGETRPTENGTPMLEASLPPSPRVLTSPSLNSPVLAQPRIGHG